MSLYVISIPLLNNKMEGSYFDMTRSLVQTGASKEN